MATAVRVWLRYGEGFKLEHRPAEPLSLATTNRDPSGQLAAVAPSLSVPGLQTLSVTLRV